jgi:hypothetical protein
MRLRGQFRMAFGRGECSEPGIRSILSAEIRFGATTKMGRTTWNSSLAVPVQPALQASGIGLPQTKTSVETENGNHRKENLPLRKETSCNRRLSAVQKHDNVAHMFHVQYLELLLLLELGTVTESASTYECSLSGRYADTRRVFRSVSSLVARPAARARLLWPTDPD